LTHDFEQVRRVLANILRAGPYGGTNMVEGIRMGISELIGLGSSEKRPDAIKVEFLLTDGFPSLPIGEGKRATPEDTNLAINAARLAGKAGIKVHVFALGEDALSYPRAAVGIARESGGAYTPVMRPADVLAVLENISVVGVDYVQIVNQTTGQKATQLRLAADGFFSSAVPVAEGRNQIDVLARASDGSNARDTITIYYQSGNQKSLELEIFLEKEKNLQLEVDRLGKSSDAIQREIERNRQDSLTRPQQLPPPTDGPVR
jgi:Glucodextranase, domain B